MNNLIRGSCCTFSDDLNEVIGGYSDGFIRSFDLEANRQRWEINAHKGAVTALFCVI